MNKKATSRSLFRYRILDIALIILLLIPVIFSVRKYGIMSNVSYEALYWDRARRWIGQSGLVLDQTYRSASPGYSILISLVCLFIKSPYAAYKIMLLLNAVLTGATYMVIKRVSSLLFEQADESVCCAVSYLAVGIPLFGSAYMLTGPQSIVMFLFWVSVFCFVQFTISKKKYMIYLSAIMLSLISFVMMQEIGLVIGVIAGGCIYCYGNQKEEKTFSKAAGLFFLLFLVWNMAEYAVVMKDCKDGLNTCLSITGIINDFSLLFSRITAGNAKYAMESVYLYLAATLLLGTPGILYCIKKIKERRTENAFYLVGWIFVCGLIAQLLADTAFRCGNPENTIGIIGLETICSVSVLIGLFAVYEKSRWSSFLVTALFMNGLLSVYTANFKYAFSPKVMAGIHASSMLQIEPDYKVQEARSMMVTLFMAVLIWIIFDQKASGRLQKWFNRILILFSVAGVLFVTVTVQNNWFQHKDRISVEELKPYVDTIQESGNAPIVYLDTNDQASADITLLSSILPDTKIQVYNAEQVETAISEDQFSTDNNRFFLNDISSADNIFLKQVPDHLYMLCASKHLGLWTDISDLNEDELDQYASGQVTQFLYNTENVVKMTETREVSANNPVENVITIDDELDLNEIHAGNDEQEVLPGAAEDPDDENGAAEPLEDADEDDEEEISSEDTYYVTYYKYGREINLTPGIYAVSVELQSNAVQEFSGSISVTDLSGEMAGAKVTNEDLDQNGHAQITIPLSLNYAAPNVSVICSEEKGRPFKVLNVLCHKLGNRPQILYNKESALRDISQKVEETDDLTGAVGSIGYVDRTVASEKKYSVALLKRELNRDQIRLYTYDESMNADTDYLIGLHSDRAYWNSLDQYTIIYYGKQCALLLKNDSEVYRKYIEKDGKTYSDGKRLDWHVFGGESEADGFMLDSGVYQFSFEILCDRKKTDLLKECSISICNKAGDEIASSRIADLEKTENEQLYQMELSLKQKTYGLHGIISGIEDEQITVKPVGIELCYASIPYGHEEKDIKELLNLVNIIQKDANVYVGILKNLITGNYYDYSYIRSIIPDANMIVTDVNNLNNLPEQGFVLTYGFSEKTAKLLPDYVILGHAGRYTLWCDCRGTLFTELIHSGISLTDITDGLSPQSIASMAGMEYVDGEVASLPDGKFNLFADLSAVPNRLHDGEQNTGIERNVTLNIYARPSDDQTGNAPEHLIKEVIMTDEMLIQYHDKIEISFTEAANRIRIVCVTDTGEKLDIPIFWVEYADHN